MEWAGTIGGATAAVVALVQVLKHSSVGQWVPKRDWGLVAIGLGIAFTYLLAQVPDNDVGAASPAAIVLCGVLAGLAASGAFETAKAQSQRGNEPGERGEPAPGEATETVE